MQLGHEQRRVWAEIDLDALEHNVRTVRAALPEDTRLCCVVKANAYGHGAPYVARCFEAAGADVFAVSNIEEAMQLRNAGIEGPILILGYTPASCVERLAGHDLIQCVYSYEYAALLSACAVRAGVTLSVHIKVDTGMGRIGFDCRGGGEQACEEIARACALPGLVAAGIFTHFAVADDGARGDAFCREQYDLFCRVIESLAARGITFDLCHCANSAAVLDHPDYALDMVRAGIVLYGHCPADEIRNRPALRPAMTLKSVISHIKTLAPGQSVSYGRTYIAPEERRIATIPIGYADGYRRANAEGGAFMLIRGKAAPIVGRACMDQLMVDISDIPGVCVGDEVIVFGRSPAMSAEQLAALDGTIPYEILCATGVRVPRVYLREGRVVAIEDHLLS